MGQITVDNEAERDYWKQQFYFLTGTVPHVESEYKTIHTISVDDKFLPQEAIETMKSVYDRNKGRPAIVETVIPSLADREAAVIEELEHNRAVIDERGERNGFTSLQKR